MAVPRGTIFQLDDSVLLDGQASLSAEGVALLEHSLEALQVQDAVLESSDPARPARQDGGSTCLTCGIGAASLGFASADEQRAHFKTDWHRYNVKRRLAGLGPVDEPHFTALIMAANDEGRGVGSLSGSDSGSDDSEAEGEAAGAGAPAGPQFFFQDKSGATLAVWRCLVAPERERALAPPSGAQCLAALRRLRQEGGRWAIILYRGGHFAAAVFDVNPPKAGGSAKGAAAAADSVLKEVQHKSFHRYVVRAKAGGKQSTQDATGKFARSAGSRLRRHNEAALQRDVAETLAAWRPELGGCDLVMLAAPGSNGRSLFAGDAPPLSKADARVRRIPFATRRPTLSEARRVARILITVYELPSGAARDGAGQGPEAAREADTCESAAAAESAAAQEQVKGAAAVAVAAAAAAVARAAAAAEEEEARQRRAEKKARQKARQREQRRAEAAARQEDGAGAGVAAVSADDEISRAAAQVAELASRPKPSGILGGGAGTAGGKASATGPSRLSAKPRADEDAATRRARMAAAAEARARALQQASQQQQLW